VRQTMRMAKRKPPKDGYDREKYRKDRRSTRIKQVLAERVEEARKRFAQEFSDFVNEAVREKLERLGFWPDWPEGYPKADSTSKDDPE
jgi:hypothetical protein